ncbi:DNRLRE domain-containing protein [uncultured Phycicoccus sp.]|uniref:CBM96 family carbohydrate-binding protein n=1 Tax=uncultured Phycicoccus sp. TaxID=661422 RepID=UPI00261666FC|nr:DNRLRE domain-containing protein [uncultured Phycicoccus sp.]
MVGRRRWTVAVAVVSTLVAALAAAPPSGAAVSACATTNGGGWGASTCLAVASTSTASGTVQVSTTVDVSTAGPRVAKVEYSMRDEYLITDYEAPYRFDLDTADYVDGPAEIVATAVFRDGTTSTPVSATITLSNGVTTQPGPTGSWTPPTAPVATKTEPVVFAAVGDGAGGEQAATDVTDMMASWSPQLFTYLGDVYEDGTITEFKNWYGGPSTWFGRFRDITAPVVGNHEYNKVQGQYVADGYFRYWNDIPHYYSFDAGGWHFIALDSTTQYGQTAAGSSQYQWLANDLATRANPCTVVMYHHPLNTVGSEAPSQRMSAIWSLLRQHDVTLVLNGHDHQYQHWMPLGADQQPDPQGVVQMVAGAGGHSSQGVQSTDARVVESAQAYGALRLEVYPERIDYTYRTPNGGTGKTLASGFLGCPALSPDTTAPTAPAGLTAALGAPLGASFTADLAWTAADDNRGVAQYRVRRDGVVVATLPVGARTYQAKSLKASTRYDFTVTALDAAGNESEPSSTASVTTPAPQPVTLTVTASEDTYTSEQSPTKNYGRSTTLRHDGDPLMQSYVKFAVTGSHSTVTKATLRVWANQKGTAFTARTVSPSWSELTMTATNAPTPGAVAGSVTSFSAGTWVDIDVTPAVPGNGTYAFQLRTTQTTAFTVDSRESGSTAPTLVVDSVPPPDTTPPTTPTGLTATAPSQNRVELSWNASTDADSVASYTVYRDGVAVDSVPGTTYVDTNVNAQRTYVYAVDAVDPSDNRSATSATASVRPPDETPPELPDPFDVVLTGPTSVGVRWGASTDNVGVTGYRLQRNGSTVAQLGPGAEAWDDDTVAPGETYIYALTASDAAGNVSEPVTGSVTIPADTSDTTPPTVPGSVQATATGETTVALGWTLSTDDNGVSGYEIFRDGASVGLVSGSTDAWLDSGRTPDTSYSYQVRAVDTAANYSALSPPATARTWAVDVTPPTVPSAVSAAGASLTSIAVSWTASTDERGVAGYRVYRDGATVANLAATQTSWTDTGLTTGASHGYAVDAVDGAGNRSDRSAPVTARTQVPPPATLSFAVAADAYVNAGSPSSKYGTATTLRLDGDPVVNSYLRFTPSGLYPTVTSAVLRISANAKNTSGFDVRTSSGAWDEGTITYANAPAFGGTVATAPPTTQGGWVEVPVTVAVTGNGSVTFVLTQTGSTAVAYASREAGGATAPTLVVTSSY